jgi:hypothetical protein
MKNKILSINIDRGGPLLTMILCFVGTIMLPEQLYRKSKKNAIKDRYDTVHNALVHCKLQGKNAIIPKLFI